MGKIYGYARVSSTEQNLDRQILELKRYVSEENIVVVE
jgi:DNA invertase Pin-like site-specific DNA recombinase